MPEAYMTRKLLNQVERLRMLADYTGDAIEKDKALWVVTQAEAFVTVVNAKLTEAN